MGSLRIDSLTIDSLTIGVSALASGGLTGR
jgi:hypothetical protein